MERRVAEKTRARDISYLELSDWKASQLCQLYFQPHINNQPYQKPGPWGAENMGVKCYSKESVTRLVGCSFHQLWRTDLELRAILADLVLWVGLHWLSISHPGDSRSGVSSHITVQNHGTVDHRCHFLHKLLCCSHYRRRDWGGKATQNTRDKDDLSTTAVHEVLKRYLIHAIPKMCSSKCMWSSPASLTAWHVYLPASSFRTRAICSTCPPEKVTQPW